MTDKMPQTEHKNHGHLI